MDFEKLTIKSGEAVAAAQELARRAGNPELTPDHLTIALLDQELPRTLVQRSGSSVETLRAEAESRLAQQPSVSGGERPAPGRRCVSARPGQGVRRGVGARRRVRLGRAPAARARPRPARRAARRAQGGARRAAGDVAGPRGLLPGAREVRPRPHGARRVGEARPRDRPRRGDPPHDPGPLPPDEEQPVLIGEPESARRRSRRGSRSGSSPATSRPASRASASGLSTSGTRRRREVPRRVRGAAQGRPPRDHVQRGPDHPLHRRAPHDRRRGAAEGAVSAGTC